MKYTTNDHTFSICAYGESEYLRECIESVINQSARTNVIICTSTPSKYLRNLADEYGIRLFVNEDRINGSNISADWNFAISCANTPLVTIAHQDDLYKREFAEAVIAGMNRAKKPLIAFSDYSELRNNEEVSGNLNLNIKRFMLFPLRSKGLWGSGFVRRRILSLGSPICCPSVTYAVNNLPDPPFLEGYRVSLDWQAWERYSRLQGDFVFINRILMTHRIHEDSETTRNIEVNNRTKEDYEMLCKFWPKMVAGFIEHWYGKSEKQNSIIKN